MKRELWKPVPSYEGWYEVSDRGRVRRVKATRGARAGAILKPLHVRSGNGRGRTYLKVRLSREGKAKQVLIHRLVAEAFHGPCPASMNNIVDHVNGDTSDNSASNLRWATWVTNATNRRGRASRGSTLSKKLTEDDVRTIRKRVDAGETRAAVGRDYGIVANQIGRICRRQSWKHVK